MSDGLRERSRARRHAAMEAAALRLFTENGYESTTLVQIAAEAEVSTRTLQLYFPSKIDLALSYSADAAERLRSACVNRPAGQTVLEVLHGWLTDEATEHGDRIARHAAMLAANPALRGSETAAITAARRAVTAEFAADLGRTADDTAVVLAAGALIGLITATLDIGTADLQTAADIASGYADVIIGHARSQHAPSDKDASDPQNGRRSQRR